MKWLHVKTHDETTKWETFVSLSKIPKYSYREAECQLSSGAIREWRYRETRFMARRLSYHFCNGLRGMEQSICNAPVRLALWRAVCLIPCVTDQKVWINLFVMLQLDSTMARRVSHCMCRLSLSLVPTAWWQLPALRNKSQRRGGIDL